jgi:hypothetical protein
MVGALLPSAWSQEPVNGRSPIWTPYIKIVQNRIRNIDYLYAFIIKVIQKNIIYLLYFKFF